MKLVELDSHPLIEKFRKEASNILNEPNMLYHLLLPPEYNIPQDLCDAILYLFVESTTNLNTWIQYGEGTYQFSCENDQLIPIAGFDHEIPCAILQTTPCTTTNGFSFDMHEVVINPFMPSPVPPLCNEIKDGFDNPKDALNYLKTRIRSSGLPQAISSLEHAANYSPIGSDNRDEIVALMHENMDKISDIVFEVKPFHYIPTLFKMRTNYIIFYAVTNLFHTKLLKAYHEALSSENSAAQRAIKEYQKSLGDSSKLTVAASHLKDLHNMQSVSAGISMVTQFFEGVLASLPDKNAAADDILPAVCDGMTRCPQFTTHIVSSFQYLADIWSMEGLDERTTYILVTCSIAASHFASGSHNKNLPNNIRLQHTLEVDKSNVDSIELIEKFLNELNK
ncbi:hypothetical protein TRFO_01110 [Tritrichomonas foetus]|uniref:Uncharacterized protein n=1 Tax=Tritrichomonas foetus TaxID=1144522 RepID=A0A1J4KJR3_9EUKA|nr:hypothetical protein TRFO_01110 [Tritrichomonas foetus]|eukprot:OHT11184.1 hypothetical protein TRFO_01110 [Tritrichomonas foetus]